MQVKPILVFVTWQLGLVLSAEHICPYYSLTDQSSGECFQILPLTPSPSTEASTICRDNGGVLSRSHFTCNQESQLCDVIKSLCQDNVIFSFSHSHHHQCGNSRFVICQLPGKEANEASVMDVLWSNSQDLVRKVLKTNLIQDLLNGTLDPQQLTSFLINDVYYISRAPKTYLNAIKRINNDDKLSEALKERYNDYSTYNDEFYNSINILASAAEGFVLPDSQSQIANYTEFSRQVSLTEEPYMTIVVNAPCSYLWCWLGTVLPNFTGTQNLYKKTISNLFGTKVNAKQCYPQLMSYLNTLGPKIDLSKKVAIFKTAVKFEMINFNSTATTDAY